MRTLLGSQTLLWSCDRVCDVIIYRPAYIRWAFEQRHLGIPNSYEFENHESKDRATYTYWESLYISARSYYYLSLLYINENDKKVTIISSLWKLLGQLPYPEAWFCFEGATEWVSRICMMRRFGRLYYYFTPGSSLPSAGKLFECEIWEWGNKLL